MTTQDTIIEIIHHYLDEEKTINRHTQVQDDLGLDSLDYFQIIGDLEEKFDILIDTDRDFKNLGDLIDYIDQIK